MGEIFSPDFTEKMKETTKKLNLSERISSLLVTIHEESVCPDLKQKLRMDKQAAVKKPKKKKVKNKTQVPRMVLKVMRKLKRKKSTSKTQMTVQKVTIPLAMEVKMFKKWIIMVKVLRLKELLIR